MTGKMWKGRFSEDQTDLFEQINYSINDDKFLALYDIEGSKSHAKGLSKIGIFSEHELKKVINALDEIAKEISSGKICPISVDEDVHMWIERLLTEKLGVLGKRVHTGRSRNDQVVTAERIWMKHIYGDHIDDILKLIDTFVNLANKHISDLLPGFTHMQAAQPISLGFYFMNYAVKLKRDCSKLIGNYEYLNILPLGSGALSGANYPIDRNFVSSDLGFSAISENAMDSVSDRDFVSDYLYVCSLIFNHLSSLSEDFIIWNSPMFNFINMSDAFSSGSSIMPQKKNPDGFELIRGKASLMSGRLVSILNLTSGMPMSYNKDLQCDKKLMYDTYVDTNKVLKLLPDMLMSITYNTDVMFSSMKKGYINATDLADLMVKHGFSFREAHEITGKIVAYAVKNNIALEDLDEAFYKQMVNIPIEEIKKALDYKNCIDNKQTLGSTSIKYIEKQIKYMDDWLVETRNKIKNYFSY